jgi:Protein of unknown function (DUF1153).
MTHTARIRYVVGPDGYPLTLANLPATTTTRWVPRRKAEVVAAVKGGLLSLEEACDRYSLSVDEFLSWQSGYDRAGVKGLRRAPRKPAFPAYPDYIGVGDGAGSGSRSGTEASITANTASSSN